MANLLGILIIVIGIAGSIGLHEIGHMWPAKKFGVKVTQYMIGFGPTMWSRKRGETEYGFKLIPLGGYIRMIGMFPPAKAHTRGGRLAATIERAREDSLAEVSPADDARTFWRLPVHKRLVVMAGGPLMNLFLAVLLFTISICAIGLPAFSSNIATVVACVPTADNVEGLAGVDGSCTGSVRTFASEHNVQPGDAIRTINGHKVSTWTEATDAIRKYPGKPVILTVQRGGQQVSIAGTMTKRAVDGATVGFLGATWQTMFVLGTPRDVMTTMSDMTVASVHALVSLPASVWKLAVSTVTGAKRDPNGPVSVVGIADVGGQVAASGTGGKAVAGMFLSLIGSINLFLFLFNLIPLLPLDGGHVAGALWEGIRRAWSRLRRQPDPGPVDTARMLPVAYVVASALILMSVVVVLADVFNPVTL
jgi:membrane-associated protease RseP (regulator of RpoE activity)